MRRGSGRPSFAWYRIELTVPDRVGSVMTKGSTPILELVVADHAEIWVGSSLPRVLGDGSPLLRSVDG